MTVMKSRFYVQGQLGEGSFSQLFKAYDENYCCYVALKVEKKDKLKSILKTEYDILKNLQGIKHIPKIYEFIENLTICRTSNLNCIEMELLGKNLGIFKKTFLNFNSILAYDILLQSITAIENLHNKGYIHRDIKPTNFVLGRNDEENLNKNYSLGVPINDINIYLVDFGLAKLHLDKDNKPFPPRSNTDFRGTLTYASLNAHNKLDLSRRDDLWSFFFMILDLLNENLPWRNCKDDKEDIQKMKEKCLANPKENLFLTTSKYKDGIFNIFNYISTLKYEDKPNYKYIYDQLFQLRLKELKTITYNYEYNCQWRNPQIFPDFYQSFLNRKFEREDDNFYYNNFKFPKYNNNITINHPTQNQIVIINQYQENIEQKFIECLTKFMINKNITLQENNNMIEPPQQEKNININENNNIQKSDIKKCEFNNDKSLIDSIVHNLNPNNLNNIIPKNKKKNNKLKSNSKKDKINNKNSKIIFVISKIKK